MLTCRFFGVMVFCTLILFFSHLSALEIDDIVIIPKVIVDSTGYSGDLAVDFNTGDLHCIWVSSWGQLKYASRSFTGQWTPAEIISTNGLILFADESDGTERWARKCCGIAVDEEGIIHIVYSVRDGDIYYISGSAGQWSEPYRVIARGHVSCHPEIVAMNGNLVIIWEDAEDRDIKEIFEISRLNGVWTPHKMVMMADNPDLIKGENGMVYLTGRLFNTRWPDYDYDHNALFGSMIPGFRDWEITQVTHSTYRLGKASRLWVFNEKIYLSWSISMGAEAIDDWDEKGKLYCAAAPEPGKEWQAYLNDNSNPVYTTATGDPYAAVAAYSDETLFYTNGKAGVLATNTSRFFRLWLGDHWSGLRLAEWENGIVHLASDGKTIWAIASSSAYNNRQVSVSGYLNPDAVYFQFGNKPPVFTRIPGDEAVSGGLWRGQCQALDPENDPVTYQLTAAPDGCAVNPSTGLIEWQTAGSDSQLIGIKALDNRGAFQVQYFYLHLTHETLNADFMADQTLGTAPAAVQFTSLSQGEIDSYLWNFGDGETSSDANPLHVYQQPGIYTVKLRVRGQVATDSLSRPDYISVSASPLMPRFAADPVAGNVPLTVLFSDSSGGDITEWQWDFGDGEGSTDRNPVHIYLSPGSYDIGLTVRGPYGENSIVYSGWITVSASSPEAEFEISPLTGSPGIPVQFTDRSSGQIAVWSWDFGDGQTSESQHPVHIYDSTGVFSVRLTVQGPGGSDTMTHDYTVQAGLVPPHAAFEAEPLEGEAPLSVKFINRSTGSFLTFSWYFGDYNTADGGMSHEENPVYVYQTPGIYSVILNIFGPEENDLLLEHNYIHVLSPADVQGNDLKPGRYALYQNLPNPFNNETRFAFDLPKTGAVTVDVYDAQGRKVRTLFDGTKNPGHYTLSWDGRNSAGQSVPSGIYIARIESGAFSDQLKMILIK